MGKTAPDHWAFLSGPANWFQLRYPRHWQLIEQRDGNYLFRTSTGGSVVTLQACWLDNREIEIRSHLNEIVGEFTRVRNEAFGVERIGEHSAHYFQGNVDTRSSQIWWKSWLQPPVWSWTRIWTIQKSQLVVVVTLIHGAERDFELENLVRMMLLSIQLPESPADPPEVFAERALELARRTYPLLDLELVDGFHLKIDSTRLNLMNSYRSYIRYPDDFERIVLSMVTVGVRIGGWGDDIRSPDFEQVRDRIMPVLYSESDWRENMQEQSGQQWVAGLAILYVVDESDSYWYVREELLKKWGLSLADLHEIAIDNLQSYFERQPMELRVSTLGESGIRLVMPNRLDSYNTTRLLCPDFLASLREVMHGDLIIGVPGRDFFLTTSFGNQSIVEWVQAQAHFAHKEIDHPLTDRLLLVTADGVSELLPDLPE
ncbi:DUF1444 family protein [Planctomicrobium sp. SH527]|uniref:DUF1444 family protein n=1 Tax=Planctomicrobium sp. SH527 TaxID=3448123 RepID=UPI003F5C4FB2